MPNSMNNPEIEDLPIGTGLAQGAKDIALWRRKWMDLVRLPLLSMLDKVYNYQVYKTLEQKEKDLVR